MIATGTHSRSFATNLLRACGLYHLARDVRRDWRFRQLSRRQVSTWKASGCPIPPPDWIKYGVIRHFAKAHGIQNLVETGTFYGNALFTLRRVFRELHSIELADDLYELNRRELGHLSHIHLYHGDSAKLLPKIFGQLSGPAVYWLDGHFCAGPSSRSSKDTPISEELTFLLGTPAGKNVVLVDDARDFTGRNDYPTVEDIRQLFARHRPQARFENTGDIMRVYPV